MRIWGSGRGTRPCSRRAARRVCFSARSNSTAADRDMPEKNCGAPVVADPPGRVHPVEPGRGGGEHPHQHPGTQGGVAVAGLAHGEDRAEHGRAVQAERHQVLPAVGEPEVLLAEADQAVEGEGGGDRRAAEQQDVRGGSVDGLLAPAALLAAFPGVVRAASSPRRSACRARAPRSPPAGPGAARRPEAASSAICRSFASGVPCLGIGRIARHSDPIPAPPGDFEAMDRQRGARAARWRLFCSNCSAWSKSGG